MGEKAKQRLGKSIINKISNIVKKYEKVLKKLDEEISLVHGHFPRYKYINQKWQIIWNFRLGICNKGTSSEQI